MCNVFNVKILSRIDQIKAMIESGDNDPFLLFAYAKELEKQSILDAITMYEKLKSTDPTYVGLYYHLAKCYEKMAQPENAKQLYQEGIIQAKKLADFHALSELNAALMELEET
jgi:tetratricopeptide (TPR) repeat protein